MEAILGSFRHRLRRRLVSMADLLRKFRAALAPQTQRVGSQRMCPFCGLITPRAKRLCLECGKPLRALPVERKDARQG
jgi:predicted amidophosphoribosyltransferase